jgi:hypothetical protein
MIVHVDLECKSSKPLVKYLEEYGRVEYRGESFPFSRTGVFFVDSDDEDMLGFKRLTEELGSGQYKFETYMIKKAGRS